MAAILSRPKLCWIRSFALIEHMELQELHLLKHSLANRSCKWLIYSMASWRKISITDFISVNSWRSSDAYMRQYNIPTLVQIMACRLFGAKPLSEPMLPYCQLDPREHISLKFVWNSKVFIKGNAVQNVVYETAAILSRPQCVKSLTVWNLRLGLLWMMCFAWARAVPVTENITYVTYPLIVEDIVCMIFDYML